MKLMLTSFGIADYKEENFESNSSLFNRMPPVSMRSLTNTFMPDYSVLLLCEKVIIDKVTFEILRDNPHPLFAEMAKTIKLLYSEGFIELVDYRGILDANQDLFQKMLENDMKVNNLWLNPLKESVETWMRFTSRASNVYRGTEDGKAEFALIMGYVTHMANSPASMIRHKIQLATEAPKKSQRKDYLDNLRDILHSYLSYVNANILIANKLDTGFHDWADFQPFYKQKFLFIGHEDTDVAQQENAVNKLFDLSFPEFAITKPSTLIKVLQDKRIAELRQLVKDAVENKVEFDGQFARNVLMDVLKTERKISSYRNIASYMTLPLDLLGFLPGVGGVVQKGVEETIGAIIDKKNKKKYRWFYLLSDISEKYEQ